MRAEVARVYKFPGIHSLPGVPGFEEPHFHRYTLEVVCEGEVDERGMVVDTDLIDAGVRGIVDTLKVIGESDVVDMDGLCRPSTVEAIANTVLGALLAALPDLRSVTVWEDEERWGCASR